MKIGRLIRRIFALLAILFVTFQPVMVPVVYAVDSWTGNPWEGNPWEGDPWDGSELEWEGNPWTGKSTEGESWSGKITEGKSWTGDGTNGGSTDGQDWTGYDWESMPWYLKGWSHPGFNGNSWNRQGWVGNGSTGNPWLNSGWHGNGTAGNPWLNPGWTGEGSKGNTWQGLGTNGYGTTGYGTIGNGTNGNYTTGTTIEEFTGSGPGLTPPDGFYNSEGFKIGHYIVKDVINGQAKFINSAMEYQDKLDAGEDVKAGKYLSPRRMFTDLAMNGMKLGTGKTTLTNAYDLSTHLEDGINAVRELKAIRDAKDLSNAGDTVKAGGEAAKDLSSASRTSKTGNIATEIAEKSSKFGALSKLNVGVAALGTGVSAWKTYDYAKYALQMDDSNSTGTQRVAAWADVGANAGDTLMNGGIVAAAVPLPGARVVGGVMVAAGAGLWVVSKGVKLFARNWKGGFIPTAKSLANKAKNAIKNTAKKAWDTVTGWFS